MIILHMIWGESRPDRRIVQSLMSHVTLSQLTSPVDSFTWLSTHLCLRMGAKHWAGAAVLLLLAVGTKAHMVFIRLFVLAAAGLAGLYLLHILATDYRKIQAARPKLLGGLLFKRSVEHQFIGPNIDFQYSSAHKHLEQLKNADLLPKSHSELSLLKMAAALDPQGCARRYICTIAARPKQTHTVIESTIIELISKSGKDGTSFREAIQLGTKLGDSKGCSSAFPRCTFSVTEMLRIIQPVY